MLNEIQVIKENPKIVEITNNPGLQDETKKSLNSIFLPYQNQKKNYKKNIKKIKKI